MFKLISLISLSLLILSFIVDENELHFFPFNNERTLNVFFLYSDNSLSLNKLYNVPNNLIKKF